MDENFMENIGESVEKQFRKDDYLGALRDEGALDDTTRKAWKKQVNKALEELLEHVRWAYAEAMENLHNGDYADQ